MTFTKWHRAFRVSVGLCSLICLLSNIVPAHCQTQPNGGQNLSSGGGVASNGPIYRAIRTTSGTKGIQRDGRFLIEDPRTQFNPTQDRKIIVYFEWEGPVGQHKFEALWKNPAGKVVVVTDFDFAPPKSPFSGYWTMLLDENAPTGFWNVDARIDGESAGSYTFEIVSGAVAVPVPHVRIPPKPAEVYHQTDAASVFVEKLDLEGKAVMRGSGFFITPDQIATTFGIIDGANDLRIQLSSGKQINTTQVAAWNRWQDWAILNINPSPSVPPLSMLEKPVDVGERCYAMAISPGGTRVISQVTVVGVSDQPPAGRRLNLSAGFDLNAAGGPVLDEYGEVIGLLGGSLLPGSAASLSGGGYPPLAGSPTSASFAVPIISLRAALSGAGAPTTLAGLAANGQFMPLLHGRDQVSFGTFALSMDKKNGASWPRDQKDQFSSSEGQMLLFINWNSKDKLKGSALVRFYDLDNRKIAESHSVNVNVRPDAPPSTYWAIPLEQFSPGVYRADVYFGESPVWRKFIRILP